MSYLLATSTIPQTPVCRGRWFYGLAVLLIGVCLWQAAPQAERPSGVLPLSSAARAAHRPQRSATRTENVLETTPIQDMRTGMKVMGENPDLDDVDLEVESITPQTHRNVVLIADKPDGGHVEMTLLRSLDWIADNGVEVGAEIDLTLTEIETADSARVVSIDACPPLEPGPGHFVTGTFKHSATNVIDLRVSGLDEPLGTTANHLFWSETRQDFIPAGQLEPGEQLRLANGLIARVLAQQHRPGEEPVYNLEVADQHVYHVGDTGVLVHNNCFGSAAFGNHMHQRFGRWFDSNVRRGIISADRTPIGMKGVEDTRILRYAPALRQALGISEV